MTAVAYVPDLMDRSKVVAALPDVRLVATVDELASVGVDVDVVVVDLGRAGVLEVLPSVRARRIVGFASHVDRDTLAAARTVGCEAMARSEFFRRLPELAS